MIKSQGIHWLRAAISNFRLWGLAAVPLGGLTGGFSSLKCSWTDSSFRCWLQRDRLHRCIYNPCVFCAALKVAAHLRTGAMCQVVEAERLQLQAGGYINMAITQDVFSPTTVRYIMRARPPVLRQTCISHIMQRDALYCFCFLGSITAAWCQQHVISPHFHDGVVVSVSCIIILFGKV